MNTLSTTTQDFADAIADHVSRSWRMERDRLYAELAELRDEVHEIGLRGGGTDEVIAREIVALNGRMEKLTQTVATMIAATPPAAELHSVKVPDA